MRVKTEASPAVESGHSSHSLEVHDVYTEHADFVWRSLQQLGVRDADLDDVLQEVFVVVHRRRHTFDGTSRVTTWLFAICLRLASRYRRRAYFRRERPEATTPETVDATTPEDRAIELEARATLEHCLGALRLDKRAVFVLFEMEGQSCQQIAELLDVPIGTVHSRLHSARKEIERRLTRLRPERGGLP